MDWANVTPGELVDALREVDWNTRPRPLTEFFAKFTPMIARFGMPSTASPPVQVLKSFNLLTTASAPSEFRP